MKQIDLVLILGLAIGSNAAAIGENPCCFHLSAEGLSDGPFGASKFQVQQLGDGQNRISQSNLPEGQYCIDSHGGVTDSYGRVEYDGDSTFWSCPTGDHGGWNVYLQPVKNQLKCVKIWLSADGCYSNCPGSSQGVLPPKPTWPSSSGSIPIPSKPAISSSISFSSCIGKPSGSKAPVSQPGCSDGKSVSCEGVDKLSASTAPQSPQTSPGKQSQSQGTTTQNKPPISQPTCAHGTTCSNETNPGISMPAKPSISKPSCSASGKSGCDSRPGRGCPGHLGSPFEFPHLIVPINKDQPDTSYGNTLLPWVSNTTLAVFNFDVSPTLAGKDCSLDFFWPRHGQMETSEFELSGTGDFQFAEMTLPVNESSTWSSCSAKKPMLKDWIKPRLVKPGSASTVWKGKCPASQKVSWAMGATGDAKLKWFQDYNPCAIGLYLNKR
ncbi:hypothetical protein K431DRAFT_310659 [Polychaeton citri CBS 116435]|uniref:Ubiquitin 3 binding protein But2 C-terminal domain-containing protein n=1 Tax=Polychaeton citri CBS 116435 TaxID=1314669 RepID=A0A9P4URI5_9PEZI|nr:hypothetical protein K431DRAFT_310659 [Polychaeton citri CBS 116435]